MKEKTKSRKRFWVNPINSTRLNEGEFHLRFQHLRKDNVKFFECYRMSVSTFDNLLFDISSEVSKSNTNFRLAISPAEKLASTLRYLGSGCSFLELHKSFRLGTSTVSAIVREVCSAIWQLLVRKYMPVPTVETWLKIAEGFEEYSNFPHCIGAIDGKYIPIMKNASIILLAVADTSYQFIYIYVCPDIKRTDSTVFERSSLWQKLSNGTLNIPEPRLLSGADDGKHVPYVFVGEKVVRLSEHILRPFAMRYLSDKRRIFNYRLERARRNVECAFAILSNKWRIFQRPLNVANDLMKNITKACCVLHNYIIQKEGYVFEDTLLLTGMYDLNIMGSSRGPRAAYDVRDYFTEYFMDDGTVPWQNSCLDRDGETNGADDEAAVNIANENSVDDEMFECINDSEVNHTDNNHCSNSETSDVDRSEVKDDLCENIINDIIGVNVDSSVSIKKNKDDKYKNNFDSDSVVVKEIIVTPNSDTVSAETEVFC